MLAAFAAGAAVTGAVAASSSGPGDTPIVELRPTGVGLPDIGATETFGVLEMPAAIRDYHDSGEYAADLRTVGGQASSYLTRELTRLDANPGPGRYNECTKKKRKGKRKRKGKKRKRKCTAVNPAIVLDIDETSLSNYGELNATNFSSNALVASAVAARSPAIEPTLGLYRLARERGVRAFFVTGRPPLARSVTEDNLQRVGYDDGYDLRMKPLDAETVPFKSGERADIERHGFTILANVGDQDSDLRGGARQAGVQAPQPDVLHPVDHVVA
jgi:HAD superfamily, subfamily IIIB (Acid phosphatase)